jgi:hypothetical protein
MSAKNKLRLILAARETGFFGEGILRKVLRGVYGSAKRRGWRMPKRQRRPLIG